MTQSFRLLHVYNLSVLKFLIFSAHVPTDPLTRLWPAAEHPRLVPAHRAAVLTPGRRVGGPAQDAGYTQVIFMHSSDADGRSVSSRFLAQAQTMDSPDTDIKVQWDGRNRVPVWEELVWGRAGGAACAAASMFRVFDSVLTVGYRCVFVRWWFSRCLRLVARTSVFFQIKRIHFVLQKHKFNSSECTVNELCIHVLCKIDSKIVRVYDILYLHTRQKYK